MKTVFVIALLALSFFLSSAQSDSAKNQAPKRLLEKGHIIKLVLTRDVGSSVAQAGNPVYFEVDSAVVIDSMTLIPKGVKAYGTVTAAQKRKSVGREGMFVFSITTLVLDNGRVISLTSDYKASGRNTTVEAVVEGYLLSPLFLLKKGKDIIYKEGRPFIAFVAQDYTF